MVKINWDKFRVVNPDCQKAFEELCYYLFCRKFRLYEGITTYHNQPGIESEPITIKNRDYGFQAKFFDNNINYSQIKKSISTAITTYKLNEIYIYLNRDSGKHSISRKSIDEIAKKKKVKLKWITQKEINKQLIENLDLAETYFQIGDLAGFLGSNLDKEQVSQVNANEYLELSFQDTFRTNKNYSDLKNAISSSKEVICLKGGAGSGKTLLMTKLCLDLQPDINCISGKITLPLVIKLRNCHSRNLDEYIFFKKQKYNITASNSFDFIYLLDGLDELEEEKCEEILNDLYVLNQDKTTKCIVISSRASSSNLILLERNIDEINYFKINPLGYKDVKNYFDKKGDPDKTRLLKRFDSDSLKNITDTLLLSLFWKEVETINPDYLDVILFDKNIKSILSDKNHKANLIKLNLLNPKDEQIISTNKEISWHLSNNSQLNISLEEVQKIIGELYPKLTYRDINSIVDYISKCFFTNNENSLVYYHRRYQEFFYLMKLQSELQTDFSILRKSHILINFEFMGNLLIPYLKRNYLETMDIINYLRIKSVESYYISHWAGEGGEYLINQIDEIVDFLANMDEKEFNFQISEDNPLLIKNIIENTNNLTYDTIHIFYKRGKKDYASYLLEKIKEQNKVIEEEIKKSGDKVDYKLRDLHEKKSKVSERIYFRISIYRNKPLSELLNEIRKKDLKPDVKPGIYGSFFSAIFDLREKNSLDIFKQLKSDEINIFLEVLSRKYYLPILFKDEDFRTNILSYIKKIKNIEEADGLIWFYCRLLEIPINNFNIIKPKIKEKIKQIEQERLVDVINPFRSDIIDHCQSNFILNKQYNNDYAKILDVCSSLYTDYINLLNNKITLRKLIYNFENQKIAEGIHFQNYFKRWISELLGYCFLFSKKEKDLVLLRNILFDNKYLNKSVFYLKLLENDKDFAKSIIDENDLDEISSAIEEYEDYNEILENNLKLAKLYLLFDFNKAMIHFKRGLSDSLVRYGWRKDYFLNHLVDSFKLLAENNWLSQSEIEEISDRILSLSSEVLKHIDGKGTNWAPDYLLKYISDFNVELAEKLLVKYSHISSKNNALGDILVKKAKASYSFRDIEEKLTEITPHYAYNEKIEEDYFINRFKIFFELAKNESYGAEKQKEFFQKAHNEINELNKKSFGIHYLKNELEERLKGYKALCETYRKKCNLRIPPEESIIKKDKKPIPKRDVIVKKLKRSKKSNLKTIFDEMKESPYCMSNEECLSLLIETCLKINNNIDLIVEYLENRWYASILPYDNNSEYDFLLVKRIFKSPKAKKMFLERSINSNKLISYPALLNVFVALNNKSLTIDVFYDYLEFCDFLIN